MKIFDYVIQDKVGIHARPANKLVHFLSGYKSNVTIKFGEKESNAKSIINLMSLGLQHNSSVQFIVDGEDEESLLNDLPNFLSSEGI